MNLQREVCLLLVNWNSSADVVRAVRAIKLEYPGITSIIVDNGSHPEDFQELSVLGAGELSVERLERNHGYAAGVNRGLRVARDRGIRWVWLMNPDALPYPGCLDVLLHAAQGAAVVSPTQLSSSLPLDPTAAPYVSAARKVGSRWSHIVCAGCVEEVHDVDVVTGTGLLVNVAHAHEAGLLNEAFFHYKEEFEFTERLGEFGAVRLVCAARLWHQRGGSLPATSKMAVYYRVRNEFLYLRLRHKSTWYMKGRTWRWTARSIGSAALADREWRQAAMLGVFHGLVGRSGEF